MIATLIEILGALVMTAGVWLLLGLGAGLLCVGIWLVIFALAADLGRADVGQTAAPGGSDDSGRAT